MQARSAMGSKPEKTPRAEPPATGRTPARQGNDKAAPSSLPLAENGSQPIDKGQKPTPSPEAVGIAQASDSVVALLGDGAGATFRRAMGLTLSSSVAQVGENGSDSKDGERLQEATKLFVELLSSVKEEKQEDAGFAELLLGYGKALVCFVRRSGASAAVLGDAVEKNDGKEQDAGEEDVEEEDDEELAWTQLEAARVVFERLISKGERVRYSERLGDVHATLGDLLLEGDAWDGAGREYAAAAKLVAGRRKAEVLYKRYLALRRDAAQEAVVALKNSVKVFEGIEKDEGTLGELREELRGFEKAVMGAVRRLEEEKSDLKTEVVIVQPRKRTKKE